MPLSDTSSLVAGGTAWFGEASREGSSSPCCSAAASESRNKSSRDSHSAPLRPPSKAGVSDTDSWGPSGLTKRWTMREIAAEWRAAVSSVSR